MPFYIVEYFQNGRGRIHSRTLAPPATRQDNEEIAQLVQNETRHTTRVVKLAEGVDPHAWIDKRNASTVRCVINDTTPEEVEAAAAVVGVQLIPKLGHRPAEASMTVPGQVRIVGPMTVDDLQALRDALPRARWHQTTLIRLGTRGRNKRKLGYGAISSMPAEDATPDDQDSILGDLTTRPRSRPAPSASEGLGNILGGDDE